MAYVYGFNGRFDVSPNFWLGNRNTGLLQMARETFERSLTGVLFCWEGCLVNVPGN